MPLRPYDPYNTSWLSRLPQYQIPAGQGWYAPNTPGRRYARSLPQPGVSKGFWQGLREGVGVVEKGLHYGLYPVTFVNEKLDDLFRYSAREHFGLRNLPEDVTRAQAVRGLLLPPSRAWGTETAPGLYSMPTAWAKQAALGLAEAAGVDQDALSKVRAQPSIDDWWNKAGGKIEERILPSSSVPRAVAGAATEFAAQLAQDPIMYVLPTAMRGAQGSYLANKLMASQKGIHLYAPKVAAALESAAKVPGAGRTAQTLATALRVKPQADIAAAAAAMGRSAAAGERMARGATLVEKMNRARKIGEGAVHYGFMTQMGLGAVGGGIDTVKQWAVDGKITPRVAEMATHSLLSGAMAGMSAVGHRRKVNLQAQAALARKQLLPAMPMGRAMPIDRIPDPLTPAAESWVNHYSKLLRDGKTTDVHRSLGSELPTELIPHARLIFEQAQMEGLAYKEGTRLISRVQDRFGDGKEGVETVGGDRDGQQFVIQRGEDGKVVGVAQVDSGNLTMIAGPKAIDRTESAGPLYEKLEEMGVQKTQQELTYLGAKARRRFAEKQAPRAVLEGRESIENIQRAQQELFDAGLGDLLKLPAYSVERSQPYFSQAMRVVEAPKTQGKMLGDQWLRFLTDQKRGVKEAELKWTGLDEYLAGKRGQRVTKQEILEFLKENQVRISETVRGGEGRPTIPYEDALETLSPLEQERYKALDRRSDQGRPLTEQDHADLAEYQRRLTEPTAEELRAAIDRLSLQGQRAEGREANLFFQKAERLEEIAEQMELGQGPYTKFGEYTVPGGEGYRELLLQRGRVPPSAELIEARQQVFDRYRPELERLNQDILTVTGQERQHLSRERDRLEANMEREADAVGRIPEGARFEGGHFEEPNVLAHVRFNDRTGPNGEKILFIEEIQSDWAQKGRREGFVDSARRGRDLEEYYKLRDEQVDLIQKSGGSRAPWSERPAEVQARLNELTDALNRLDDRYGGDIETPGERGREPIPAAPFVEKTGDWSALAMKRMLKWAADNGYDKVAWTTGDIQAARYDLSRRVSRVVWREDQQQLRAYDLGGNEVISRSDVGRENLVDYIGKEPADRLMAQKPRAVEMVRAIDHLKQVKTPPQRLIDVANMDGWVYVDAGGRIIDYMAGPGRTAPRARVRQAELGALDRLAQLRQQQPREISGLDLRVGGEGMKGFYDQILPKVAGKLAKRFGAKVSETEIDVTGMLAGEESARPEFQTGKWAAWGPDEIPRPFNTEAEARAYAEQQGGDYAIQNAFRVHSIELTPEMKSSVREQGFPLFDVERRPPEQPSRPMPDAEGMRELREQLVQLYPDGTKITEAEGRFDIRVPDGRMVRWRPNQDFIEIDTEAFQKARGRKPTPEEVARGVTYRMSKGAVVDLVKGADPRTTIHEQWHVLKHMGFLTDKQQASLRRRFKTEEAEADAFADWWLKEKKPTHSVFEQVSRGIKRVYQMITGASERVFEQVLRDSLQLQKKPGAPRLGAKAPRIAPNIYVERGDALRNLNWHLSATGQMPARKGAKYRKDPVEGNTIRLERDGKPFFIGPINFDQWMEKATAWVGEPGSAEWTRARNWYRDLLGEFDRVYGKKDGERMLTLWALTQQLEGPAGGMGNLLRAEDVVSGFRPEDAAKAGLAHERLITALRGGQPELSSPKLPDFLDAVHEVLTRQYVNNDARGGRPAPVDVHAGRDVGFVDQTVVNKVRKFFGDEIADGLVPDMAKKTPEARRKKGARGEYENAPPDAGQYLYGHEFYNRLADYLNQKGIDGGGFKPSEVQAIGWVAQQRMFGDVAEGPRDIFAPNLSHIAVEVAPGAGSALEAVWNQIPEGKHAAITARVLDEIVPEAAKLSGVRIIDKADQVGVWQQFDNPNGVVEILSTPEGALRFAKVLGHALQQSEVWAQRVVGKSRKTATGVDIGSTSGYNFGSRADVRRFWQEALAQEPGLGASVVRDAKGSPILRILAEDGPYGVYDSKVKAVTQADLLTERLPTDTRKKDAYRVESLGEKWVVAETEGARVRRVLAAVDKWAGDREYEYSLPNVEVLKSINDWSVNHAGEAHRTGLRGVEGEVLDGLARRAEESLRRNVGRSAEAEERVYREPEPGGPRRGVDDPPQPRGPPADPELGTRVGREQYATDTAPSPPPDPTMGRPKPPGRRPRVEERVENLEGALAQQRELGIPQENLVLSREHRRIWDTLDPEVKRLIQNWNDDAILKITKQRSFTDTEVMALDAVVRGRREAKELARLEYAAEKGGPNEDAAWTKYVESLANYLPLERANINDGTGTARALAARARLMNAARTKDQQFLRQVLREKDAFPGLTEKDVDKLVQWFEQGDPRLADGLRSAMAGRWKQWQTLLRAFLITPSSEIPNLLGNTIVQGVELTDTAFSSGLDWAVSKLRGTQRERYLGEVGAEMGGMIEAVPSAMLEFLKQRFAGIYKRAWTGESRPLELGRRLEYQVSPFKSKAGRLIATSLDALAEGDRLFRAPIAQGELLKRSYRQAVKDTGQKLGPDVQSRALEIAMDVMKRPEKHGKMIQEIQSATSRRLFQGKPWGAVDLLRELERRYPWTTAVLPFVRTPANIARYAVHHSPMGFLTPDSIRAIKVVATGKPFEYKDGAGKTIRKMGQGEATDIIAQRLTGTMFFGMALGATKMGKLTGSGPVDWDERKALMETGWRPYSIIAEIDGRKVYIPFARFDPVSQVVGIAADVAEFENTRDGQDLASKAIGSVAENFTDRTYLKGMIDFTEALNDPIRFAGNYAIGIGTMHIPRQLARIAIAYDPVIRDVRPLDRSIAGYPEKVVKSIARNLPGVSTMLPPRVGPTGEPLVRPGEGVAGAVMRAVSPIQVSPERTGRELEGLMAEIGYVPSEPRTYITIQGNQIQLDREDLDLLQRADRNAAFELRRLLASPMFQGLPDTIEEGGSNSKESVIRKTYDKYRTLARRMMFQSPSFRARARQQLQEARTS